MSMFINFAVVVDPLLFIFFYCGTSDCIHQMTYLFMLFIWMLLSKAVKLIGLLRQNPLDIRYLPVIILFGYFHSFIKVYALCTLNNVGLESVLILATNADSNGRSHGVLEGCNSRVPPVSLGLQSGPRDKATEKVQRRNR